MACFSSYIIIVTAYKHGLVTVVSISAVAWKRATEKSKHGIALEKSTSDIVCYLKLMNTGLDSDSAAIVAGTISVMLKVP